MASFNKIHVNSSTGLSLNDRFTAMAERSSNGVRRGRSRSRSLVRELAPVDPISASANRRLLLQLERRHKMLAAMKLKRRSLRTTGFGTAAMKRGNIKALRVAPNGKPIKANTLSDIATMNADLIGNGRRRRPLRRAGSTTNIVSRLGLRQRRGIGGAAERVAKRRLTRLHMQLSRNNSGAGAAVNRRSRSRVRGPAANAPVPASNAGMMRGRSQSRDRSQLRGRPQARSQSQTRGRPQSRTRRPIMANNTAPVRRGRSMSRNRGRVTNNRRALPIKARLGVRPGSNLGRPQQRRDGSINPQRGVLRGRVQRRPVDGQNGRFRNGATGGRLGLTRGRSRSRTRKGQQIQSEQLQQAAGNRNDRMVRRGRNGFRQQQRGSRNGNANGRNGQQPSQQRRGFKSGNGNGRNGPQHSQQQRGRGQQQQRRGRGGGRTLGNNTKAAAPNKDDLDKELDQYMATTKTDRDMDYLLKN